MYLSKSRNFLFSAVPRTGTHTTIEALAAKLPPESSDVVIQFNSANEYAGIPNTYEELLSTLGRADVFPPGFIYARYATLLHLTPKNLISLGLVTLDELKGMTTFGFVRDPIDRYLSICMLQVSLGVTSLGERTAQEFLIDYIRNTSAAVAFPMRDFFEVDGEQVVTPYHMDNMLTPINALLSSNGLPLLTELPIMNAAKSGYPTLQDGDTSWIPTDCMEKLNTILADDIAFYNSLTL